MHQCIRPLLGAHCAPDHHGYQRACDLISGQASTGPLGPPVFGCAGKTDFSIVVSSSRRPRRVDYIIDGSSFHGCSFVRAWRPFLRPGLRVQVRRAQGPSRLAVARVLPLASMLPGHALYEAFQVKRYLTAFFTFFIPVSLFDLESRFFAPTHTCLEVDARRSCQGRPSLCAGLRSIVSRPSLDSLEHVGTLVVVGMTRPRGARCRGTMDSRRNLVSGGSQ